MYLISKCYWDLASFSCWLLMLISWYATTKPYLRLGNESRKLITGHPELFRKLFMRLLHSQNVPSSKLSMRILDRMHLAIKRHSNAANNPHPETFHISFFLNIKILTKHIHSILAIDLYIFEQLFDLNTENVN